MIRNFFCCSYMSSQQEEESTECLKLERELSEIIQRLESEVSRYLDLSDNFENPFRET